MVATLAVPAAAGFGDVVPDEQPVRLALSLHSMVNDAFDRALDVPDIEAVVKLDCQPRRSDAEAAVACEWRADDDLGVRSWQLWKLQVRPERGGRTLVAQLGADATAHTDLDVTVPAAYLYAVLGLDADGTVIARSRVDPVQLNVRDHQVEPMRLECAAHPIDSAPGAVVGCEWNEVSNDAAVGYILWKSVDGGERAEIARVGLETTHVRDDEVAPGHRFTYVVTAVDQAGAIVGQSRSETVGIAARDRVIEPVRDAAERDRRSARD